jgi:hypothetical protein
LGIEAKRLMSFEFSPRTDVGAIRCDTGRFRDFLTVSAGILTGFSTAPSEN